MRLRGSERSGAAAGTWKQAPSYARLVTEQFAPGVGSEAGGQMSSPQVQLGVSVRLVKKALRELVPNLLPCPSPQPADEKAEEYVTQIEVTEVVALRADERMILDAASQRADRALKDLGAALGFDTTETKTVITVPSQQGGSVTLTAVPRTFLLVGCRFPRFSSEQLHQLGSSDLIQRDDFQRITSDPFLGALLFSVDALALQGDVGLAATFLCVFNSGLVTSAEWVARMQQLRTTFGTPVRPLNLTALLTGLGLSGAPMNVGISAPPRSPSPPVGGIQELAFRVGIDPERSADADGWRAFYRDADWLLQATGGGMQDVAAAIDGRYLEGVVDRSITQAIARERLPAGLSVGPPQVTVGTGLRWGGVGIELRLPVWESFVGAGDVVAGVSLALRTTTRTGSPARRDFLDATLCAEYDQNLGTAALVVVGSILTGGLLAAFISPSLVVMGGIIGADLAFQATSLGQVAGSGGVSSALGQPLGRDCGPMVGSCRTCSVVGDVEETPIGRLLLTQVTVAPAGVAIVWTLESSVEPALSRVAVQKAGRWHYVAARACEDVDPDPVTSINISNVGGLPLTICSVTQYVTTRATARILEFGAPGARTRTMLAPGRSTAVAVRARADDPSYDPSAPPPLYVRVFTSGGFEEIDLNASDTAQPQSPEMIERANLHSKMLCTALINAEHSSVWHQVTFTDPIPFHLADVVRERVDVRATLGAGRVLEGSDLAGRLLGRTAEEAGVATLSLSEVRGPATEHEHMQVSALATSAAGRAIPSIAPASDGDRAVARWLYRASRRIDLGASVLAVATLPGRLVVLTDQDVRVAVLEDGAFGEWSVRPVPGATALACVEGRIALGSSERLLLLDPRLAVVRCEEGGCRALAAAGDRLWIARPDVVEVAPAGDARPGDEQTIRLPGVTQMTAAGELVLALVDDWVWVLSGDCPRPLGMRAVGLTTHAGRPAAVQEDAVVVFDDHARPLVTYAGRPWLAGLVEWDDMAVEVLERGLVLHDRYPTTIDPERNEALLRASHAEAPLRDG
jgi:hypothetical protein